MRANIAVMRKSLLNGEKMKNFIVGALLISTLAFQNASAEIRTFAFTANISSLTLNYVDASSLPGIDAGTTVNLGDLVNGQFSFDDGGQDFVGSNTSSSSENIIFNRVSFSGLNGSLEMNDFASWSYDPNFGGTRQATFMLAGVNAEQLIAGGVTVYSPRYEFEWELDDDTAGLFHLRWNLGNGVGRLNADMTSLIEVSAVPEPSTYAMFLVGAALVGGAARYRAGRRAA